MIVHDSEICALPVVGVAVAFMSAITPGARVGAPGTHGPPF